MIVFTGPVLGKSPIKMNGRIPVPRAMFKILFDPKTLDVWSFIIPNEPNITSSMLPKYLKSLDDIHKETGLKFLPKAKVLNYCI
jgi:DNA/RNA endonuclease G (NUC1)